VTRKTRGQELLALPLHFLSLQMASSVGLPYRDRRHAGEVLAGLLQAREIPRDTVVLALPRGGVPVAAEVAKALEAPLDVFLVRKLGVPGHEELAMGAIASGGTVVLNQDVVGLLRLNADDIRRATDKELLELSRQERVFRGNHPAEPTQGRGVILIDDGLATGATMRAAARAIRATGPSRTIVAVPVAAKSTCEEFQSELDEVVCAATPEPFQAVGLWYQDFSQTSDDEVRALLGESRQRLAVRAS
jgi:putative phosphoribosyl transferase